MEILRSGRVVVALLLLRLRQLLLRRARRLLSLVALRDALLSLLFLRHHLVPRSVPLGAGPSAPSLHLWIPSPLLRRLRPPRPALVLVHGFGGNAKWQWERQIGPLSRSFDLYVPDLLFFGRSKPGSGSESESESETPGSRSVAEQARCVAEAMARLGVGRYAVVGISYGGFVAYRLAGEGAVERVVILSAGVCAGAEERGELARREGRDVSEVLLPQRPEDLRTLLRRSMHRPPKWVPDFLLRDFIQGGSEFLANWNGLKEEKSLPPPALFT
ncbi:uncharacterized protein LOC109704575 [Ananas comosus]|uniref:Uncharacterized protein LOC109704575 n=1 Tax=Ananas comosus TaxID=4615 RepID=A0A6P5EC38_ANACO|nr:uncharacterized protein LOC109704575 [Ananas comosus]